MNELPRSALIVGYARTGQAVARVLASHGVKLLACDDNPSESLRESAFASGVELIGASDDSELMKMLSASELVVLSPGVAPSHHVFALAQPERVISEIELAYRLATVPIVAVTGTNGKTTVTGLVAAMLASSGIRTAAAGNIGVPLIDAVCRTDLEVIVAEVSSFQLAYTTSFRPFVGTWLNLAEDHLDWHDSMAAYGAAKAKIWSNQGRKDFAVGNRGDRAVYAALTRSTAQKVTFGPEGDYRREGNDLLGPAGAKLMSTADLCRSLPHDVENALAALATACSAGASLDGCRTALKQTAPPPHRVEHVASYGGISYYDDSKATTPSAVMAALAGFSSVVLIAGGRNKGLSLGAIAEAPAAAVIRAVVAIGESSEELARSFERRVNVQRATSMSEAVTMATEIAEPGDTVLLSPGAASFDWYSSYEARGEEFRHCVETYIAGSSSASSSVANSGKVLDR